MLYAGMLFFSLAIVSGLYAFADVATTSAHIGQTVFYGLLMMSSLSFARCLGRATRDGRVSRQVDVPTLRLAGVDQRQLKRERESNA